MHGVPQGVMLCQPGKSKGCRRKRKQKQVEVNWEVGQGVKNDPGYWKQKDSVECHVSFSMCQ